MSYPPPAYSHRNATGTGPGEIIDIGTDDATDYPPVLIIEAAPTQRDILVEGALTALFTDNQLHTDEVVVPGDLTFLSTAADISVDVVVDGELTWLGTEEPVPGPQGSGCNIVPPNGVALNIQSFTADGTWNRPVGSYTWAVVTMISAGGGGGGGLGSHSSNFPGPLGGQAGGGGEKKTFAIAFASLPSSVPVVVGAGGPGGLGGRAIDGNPPIPPTAGTPGGDSKFGIIGDDWYVIAQGGGAGNSGQGTGGTHGGGGPNANWPTGNCYGAPGGQYVAVGGISTPDGGSSISGAPGGGLGGGASFDYAIPPGPLTERGFKGFDGGVTGTNTSGGGGEGGIGWRYTAYETVSNAQDGAAGTPGDSKTPGTAGGGGGVLLVTWNNGWGHHAGFGGAGGWPGAGGGGGGGGFQGAIFGGDGGPGADGSVVVECW